MTYKEEVEGLIDELINGPLKQLGISHYRIDVRINHTDDPPCTAEARTSKNYASATIIVYANAINVDRRSLRETLIHELIHVAHRDLDNTLDLMMDEISDMKVLNTLDSMRVNAIEDFVDRLARTIDANLV
jgi:hypothetical protein